MSAEYRDGRLYVTVASTVEENMALLHELFPGIRIEPLPIVDQDKFNCTLSGDARPHLPTQASGSLSLDDLLENVDRMWES